MRSESSKYKLGRLDKDYLFWNLCWHRPTLPDTDSKMVYGRTIKIYNKTKKIWVKKLLVQIKNFVSKINLYPKQFLVKIFFGSNKYLGQINFGCKIFWILGPKNKIGPKNCGSKKILGHKHFWIQKNWSKKLSIHNVFI